MTNLSGTSAAVATLIAALAALGLAGNANAQGCVDPAADVVAWWPGDGNTTDLESGLDAKLMGGADFAPGLVGEAFRLDGASGQLVRLSRLAADGLADLTVDLWVRTTSGGAIFSAANGDDPSGNELLLYSTPTALSPVVKSTGTTGVAVSLADDAWHHVAFVREANTGRVYVDGVRLGQSGYPAGSLQVGPRGLLLGQEQDCLAGCFDATQAFVGLIDEVTIYGRALSDVEVAAVHAAGADGKCKPTIVPPVDDELVMRVEDLETDVDGLAEELDATRAALQATNDELEAALGDIDALEGMAHVHGQDRDEHEWKHKHGKDKPHHHDHH